MAQKAGANSGSGLPNYPSLSMNAASGLPKAGMPVLGTGAAQNSGHPQILQNPGNAVGKPGMPSLPAGGKSGLVPVNANLVPVPPAPFRSWIAAQPVHNPYPGPPQFRPMPPPVQIPPPQGLVPGRVEVYGSLSSSSMDRAPPPPDPTKCLFCTVGRVQSQTPCGHGYCGRPCIQRYITVKFDGSHYNQIPCAVCRTPLPFPFLVEMFGDENLLRKTLREHVEGVLKGRVCPGNEQLFNELTGYKPMPPFTCPTCQMSKPYQERWDLDCTHSVCKECLRSRITQSVSQRTLQQINCPVCAQEIPYVSILCLVPQDVRVAYEQIVPSNIVFDKDTSLIYYTCHIHTSFHIVIDGNRPWVKCDICNIRYCTRCPGNTLYQNHVCPN